MNYFIGYDLDKPGQDYASLEKAIKNLGSWWHCLDSTWIVISNLTAIAIRDILMAHIDSNDKLLVAVISAPAAWTGFSKECADWLTANL